MKEHIKDYSPECRASSQIINSDEDDEDEEPRPSKRRKRNSQFTRQTPYKPNGTISQSSRSPDLPFDMLANFEPRSHTLKDVNQDNSNSTGDVNFLRKSAAIKYFWQYLTGKIIQNLTLSGSILGNMVAFHASFPLHLLKLRVPRL